MRGFEVLALSPEVVSEFVERFRSRLVFLEGELAPALPLDTVSELEVAPPDLEMGVPSFLPPPPKFYSFLVAPNCLLVPSYAAKCLRLVEYRSGVARVALDVLLEQPQVSFVFVVFAAAVVAVVDVDFFWREVCLLALLPRGPVLVGGPPALPAQVEAD